MPSGQSLLQGAADRLTRCTGLLGLTVSEITVEGRETTDRETILAALAAGPGTPILAVSPTHVKEQLEALPWVRTAVIERRLPGTLYVRLVERKPLALWQHGGKLELVDREGNVIPVARLDRFAKLPLVVGEGAASHAAVGAAAELRHPAGRDLTTGRAYRPARFRRCPPGDDRVRGAAGQRDQLQLERRKR